MSRGIDAGSFSVLSSGVFEAFDIGVFHGTEISLTGWFSTDSVADMNNSCE